MLLGGAVACEDDLRVRTLDPVEPADASGDASLDAAPDAVEDASTDMPPPTCEARVAALDQAEVPGPETACTIAPPAGCDQLARCVCSVLAPDAVADCVTALVVPRALINLSDSCLGDLDLGEVCRRDLWHMSAPSKFTLSCSPGCAAVPATLAER